ncbi:S8 family serine peptidase [Streptomyces sp. CAU 1734]|uniref:S8 family peptidase n=1 Tax=Streptomyces sp. CAU 1734 TaxID=3140360 RepID=UPI0032601504
MFNRHQRAGAAALTAAVSLALVAGMTGAGSATASPAPGGSASGVRAAAGGTEWVTLITGDRVRTGAKGKVTGFVPAKGRETVPVQIFTEGGHTHVVPHDARRLIADGRLDRRLFDVTELSRAESRKAYADGLRVIVAYAGSAGTSARQAVRAAGGTEPSRSLRTLNADAVTAAPGLWETLTKGTGTGARATASGISRIWLDGIRKATLEKSTGQIGAPSAWQSGYEGKGVKIAVLDTGVDAEHLDLKGRVIASRNFSAAPDAVDRQGHGTHVASTAAGSGAKSNGTHKGVAPQAEIISGKVLDDEGYGSDSETIAGIEWAVAQGADIVNLSLGSRDHPGIDPVEAQVNKVTAEKGVLFAVAAGNAYGNAIGSPGSADGAFTVGAVDRADKLADFSSTGPRLGGGIKPDVAAPGVDISAAAASGTAAGDYAAMSGTSMATPHVAGAAALLKQKNPQWKAKELRTALASSAKGTGHTPYETGTGRIAVEAAMNQSVFADEVSLDLGKQLWPRTDDQPVTKKLTYRNSGTADITLDLTVTGHAPGYKPAPAGFFTLGSDRVTVPAGGTASVDVTADTRIGADDGHFTASVVASGGGQTVRSTAAIEREAESYEVTLKHIGRDGKPSPKFETALMSRTVPGEGFLVDSLDNDAAGEIRIRLPKGEYVLNADARDDRDDFLKGRDVVVQPKLTVDRARTVTIDARSAKPVKPTVPDAKAAFTFGVAEHLWTGPDGGSIGGFYPMNSLGSVRMAHLGPQVTDGSLNQTWTGSWRAKSGAEYKIATSGTVKRIPTGYTRAFKAAEFATVKAGLGVTAKGKRAVLEANAILQGAEWGVPGYGAARPLPDTRTVHVLAGEKTKWGFSFAQIVRDNPDGGYDGDVFLDSAPKVYQAGKSYQETFNTAVFAPLLDRNSGAERRGDQLRVGMPLFSDGRGHSGASDITSAATALYRDGKKIATSTDPLSGRESLAIGRDAGLFKLTTSVKRSAATARVSTRIDADWTFRAKAAPTDDEVTLPISTVRFSGAKVGLDNTAAAGASQVIPLQIHGAAAKGNVKALTAHASYDGGKTWQKLTVTKNKVTVRNPAKGKAITLRAEVTDKQGGTAKVTVYNAFFGK